MQFASCWTVTALLAAGTLLQDRGRQAALALGIVALACVAFRLNRYVEVAQSWAKRDPAPVAAFLQAHVPRDATVYTNWTYYFAAYSTGARVQAYYLRDMPLWRPTGGEPPAGAPRFLVGPDPGEDPTSQPRINDLCATSNRIAVFEPAALPAEGLLARLPVHAERGAVRGYARTFLYRVPDGCVVG